nr:zinc-ribbon domain-containing protein [Candidatus Freyarchaeota archaeon]
MDRSVDDYDELAKLLRQIGDFISEDKYDKLGGLLARVRRLRRKGVNVDFNMVAPVLEAFTKAISDYIEEGEYDDATETIDDLGEFLETFDLTIGEESASRISDAYVKAISDYIEEGEYDDATETIDDLGEFLETFDLPIREESANRISDAYVRKISECIKGGEYDDAEEWIDDLGEFLETFSLTADENMVSKVIDSYTSLVEAYIGAKEFHRADEIKELIGEFKEGAKPFKWSTGPEPKVVRPAVKTAGLRCAYCGKELPPGASFCPNCGKPLN